jgi:hypothetical protein
MQEEKMDALSMISKKDLRELLVKCWITHDAMWLLQSIQACGAEKASAMNTAAVEAMALIEIQRIKKALGVTNSTVETFDDLIILIEGAFSLIKGDFMKFTFSFPKKNVFQWEWADNSCFAYEGVKKLGIADQYQCGIMVRVEAWLKGLGVEYLIEPEIDGCLMRSNETCFGHIQFNFAT